MKNHLKPLHLKIAVRCASCGMNRFFVRQRDRHELESDCYDCVGEQGEDVIPSSGTCAMLRQGNLNVSAEMRLIMYAAIRKYSIKPQFMSEVIQRIQGGIFAHHQSGVRLHRLLAASRKQRNTHVQRLCNASRSRGVQQH